MDPKNPYIVFVGGWWDDEVGTGVLEDNDKFLDGWFNFEPPSLETRIERIENFLRDHNFLFINSDGDEKEAVFPW